MRAARSRGWGAHAARVLLSAARRQLRATDFHHTVPGGEQAVPRWLGRAAQVGQASSLPLRASCPRSQGEGDGLIPAGVRGLEARRDRLEACATDAFRAVMQVRC